MGFKNKNGKTVIKARFEQASDFENGLAKVKLKGKYGFIDCEGNMQVPAAFDLLYPFSDNMALVLFKDKYGFIEKTGDFIIPAVYDLAYSFSEGLAVVKQNDKYGYINKQGEFVIPLMFDNARSFENGLARVELNEKEAYIDNSGKLFLDQWFNSVGLFKEDILKVRFDNLDSSIVKDRGQCVTYYRRDGSKVIDTLLSDGLDFDGGRAKVALNGQTYYLTDKGELIMREADRCDDALFYLYDDYSEENTTSPQFPGGDRGRLEFLMQNVRYPQKAREEGAQGTVYIQFIVSETGEILRPRILRGVHPDIDKECLRIIRLMPRWEPRMVNGEAVCTLFNMPIKFTLQG